MAFAYHAIYIDAHLLHSYVCNYTSLAGASESRGRWDEHGEGVKAELTHTLPPHTARDCLLPPLSGFGEELLQPSPSF